MTHLKTVEAQFERSPWRLIIDDDPRSGVANMALDQAIAEACATHESLPTLRFYQWSPPSVSLGRHQRSDDIDREAVNDRGYEVVRRPTGGRAILHIDEFTYSVAAPQDEPRVAGSVMDAYLRLSLALLTGLQNLGVGADTAPSSNRAGPDASAACFEIPSAYEIMAYGRKLIGSAQSRRAGYVLQHGSLPLRGDIGRLVDILTLPPTQAKQLRDDLSAHAGTLAQGLDVKEDAETLHFATVAQAMHQGFAKTLNLDFQIGTPSPLELRQAATLIRERYGNDDWTFYR